MSDHNDGTTGAQIDNEPREATFEEGVSLAERELQKRKVREYELPTEADEEPVIWRFTIKKLTAAEHEEVEDAAVSVTQKRNDTQVETDSGELRKALIKNGVVEGPEGFKLSDRHIEKLPYEVKEDLADSIEQFSELPEEERVAF